MIQGRIAVTGVGAPSWDASGILVSNGREVTTTTAGGSFELPRAPEDRFVTVTTPAGFDSDGPSYQRLTASSRYDFQLRVDAARGADTFSFVHITDIHLGGHATAAEFREDLDRIYDEVGDETAFVAATGDLTELGTREAFAEYLEAVEGYPLPIYPGIGNHDDGDSVALGDHFNDALGPVYYSFDYGPVHFVVYDGVGHTWRVPDHQEAWVRANLDAVPSETPVVFFLHYPWGDTFYNRFRDDRVIASLSGHWHCCRVFRDGQMTHYNTPPLCFGGLDQSPGAFRFCTYRDGEVTSTILNSRRSVFSGTSFRPELSSPESFCAGPEPSSSWLQFRGDARRTGCTDSGPAPPLELGWKASAGGGIHLGSPVLTDGTLILGTQNEDVPESACVTALDATDGSIQWRRTVENSIKLSPAVHNDLCYVVTVTGEVSALSVATGEPAWNYALGNESERWVYSAPLVYDGLLYLGMSPHFACLDPGSGEVVWVRDDFGDRDWVASYPSPAGFEDAVVIAFHGVETNLVVVEKDTGKSVWENEEHKTFRISTTPVVAPDGSIYVVSGATLVRAFDVRTGTVLWKSDLSRTRCVASPALDGDRLYVPTGDGTLHALDPASGGEMWSWESGEGLASFNPYLRGGKGQCSSPLVVDDVVYFGSTDGHLYALDAASGNELWSHDLQVPSMSSPVVSGEGLWLASCNGMIHAFRRKR